MITRLRIIPVLIALLCISADGISQKDTSAYDHVAIGFFGGVGEGFAPQLEIAAHFKPKMFARFHFLRMTYVPDDVPDDYSPVFCFPGSCKPKNELMMFSVLIGKKIVDKHKISFSIEAGPSVTRLTTVKLKQTSSGGFFGSSYESTYTTEKAFGFIMIPRLEAKITRYTSLQLLLLGNINSVRSAVIPTVGVVLRSKAVPKEPDPLPPVDQD